MTRHNVLDDYNPDNLGTIDIFEFRETYPYHHIITLPAELSANGTDKPFERMEIHRWLKCCGSKDHIVWEIANPYDDFSSHPFWLVGIADVDIAVMAKLRYNSNDWQK
jgi:hypothetical protein